MKKQVKIEEEFIKLDQLLKYSDAVSSGGEAKLRILSGEVKVNGITISQRGKKIRPGDVVQISEIEIHVIQ